MNESFTDRGRKALQYANQAARRHNQEKISPLMLCVGVVQAWLPENPQNELIYCALKTLGFTKGALLSNLRDRIGARNNDPGREQLPYDQPAQQIIQAAIRSAQSVNGYADNRHLLFALLRCEDSIVQSFFTEHNLTAERIQNALPKELVS